MADELDNLFGAFDGDATQDEPQPKKARLDDDNSSSQAGVCVTSDPSVSTRGGSDDKPSNDDKPETTINGAAKEAAPAVTRKSKSSYSTVMSQPSASHLRETSEASAKMAAPTTTTQTSTGEIATGTSHDKSVRSYTAYPQNLPPGHVPAKVEPPSKPSKDVSIPSRSLPIPSYFVY